MSGEAWRVWVDTGGTFTDCLAVSPVGEVRRAKVLSSSALRGTIVRRLAPDAFEVEGADWMEPPGLAVGLAFRLLADARPGADAGAGGGGERSGAGGGDRATSAGPGGDARQAHAAPLDVARPAGDGPPTGPDGPGSTRSPRSRPPRSGASPPSNLARVVAVDPDGRLLRLDRPLAEVSLPATFELRSAEEAPVLAARLATGTPTAQPLPPIEMRLATTRGTNALLERRGAPIAFFVTRGFADLLRIGTQQRPDLFALHVERPLPLPVITVEADERIAADGAVVTALDDAALEREARRVLDSGVRVAAVAFVNAYRNPEHEREAADRLRRAGFAHVSASADLSPAIHLLHRAETACVDAYLAPLFDHYLRDVARALGPAPRGASLRVMTSAGGLVAPLAYRPKDSLLSGPAAGIVGAAEAGRAAGFTRVLSFDMGGTSTDVARFDGEYDYTWRHRVGDVELLAPALAIESLAAGGGSICRFAAGGLAVGPESAGADPGPACYGAGGPLTLTDCNLLLGRLRPERFGIPLDPDAARAAAHDLHRMVAGATGAAPPLEELLEGLVAIADEKMADAIRAVSVRRGYDPADFAMVAFGGAGGQHACGVAERLGVRTIVLPPDAALLSARGLGSAALERLAERQVLRGLDGDPVWLRDLFADAEHEALSTLARDGADPARSAVARRIANLRLLGQNATLALDVEIDRIDSLADHFAERYAALYGYPPEGPAIEVESIRVLARCEPLRVPLPASDIARPSPPGSLSAWVDGARRDLPAFERSRLPDHPIPGPALVLDPHTTLFVAPGWAAEPAPDGALVVRKQSRVVMTTDVPAAGREGPGIPAGIGGNVGNDKVEWLYPHPAAGSDPEEQIVDGNSWRVSPVEAELFVGRFDAVVREMGGRLRRTALSVNVKERLDFSCALLDREGELVANAPHIPVHLGALGLCVRAVAAALPMGAGDVVVTNHPAYGGSHLPDVTVITPVEAESGERVGYVASRAHHAEIGGTRPGSMPPDARWLEEEGVVIPPTFLVRGGVARWDAVERLFRGAKHPSRAVEDNLADLRAQVAANQRGVELLRAMARDHGVRTIDRHMRALTARCERLAVEALSAFPAGEYTATERLDDGSPIAVRIAVSGGRATVDFAGTGPVHPGNLNATPAIVRSVVLYVVRLLIAERVPLNEGLLRPIDLVVRESLLNPPFRAGSEGNPAVVGGNTEVSQRLVDALLRALDLAACSQGTMNNVLWGTDELGYYETIGGGAGASAGHPGASGVHTHMTNTRITDVEVMESRYPVRLLRFALRGGSGGGGRWRGGDGIVREMAFLAPMQVSVLAQHRRVRPYGAHGGEPGAVGSQRVVRATGEVVDLAGMDACDVASGDRLVVETPGGGGWGAAGKPAAAR